MEIINRDAYFKQTTFEIHLEWNGRSALEQSDYLPCSALGLAIAGSRHTLFSDNK